MFNNHCIALNLDGSSASSFTPNSCVVGQFGSPLFNITIFVGFVSTVVSSIFETIGDYFCAANLCGVPPPPDSAVNRGILWEGLGSVLSGAVGAGHATTSSTGNLVLIGISKVCLSYKYTVEVTIFENAYI